MFSITLLYYNFKRYINFRPNIGFSQERKSRIQKMFIVRGLYRAAHLSIQNIHNSRLFIPCPSKYRIKAQRGILRVSEEYRGFVKLSEGCREFRCSL